MRKWLQWLMRINSDDQEVLRRGRNLIIISLGLILFAALCIPLPLQQADPTPGLLALLFGAIAFVAAIALARRGYVDRGNILVLAMTILPILSTFVVGQIPPPFSPFYMVLPIIIAGVVMRPAHIWVTFVVSVLGLFGATLISPVDFLDLPHGLNATLSASFVMLTVTLLGFLSARSAEQALLRAHQASQQVRQASAELERINAGLEAAVAERTSALSAALASQQAQADELRASLEAQQRLSQLVEDLSLPIIPVREDVLVAPLVGNLDSERAQQLLSHVIGEVERRRAAALVLDITGVPVVDTHIAQTLLKVAEATRLLGASAILVGIRPEVAQALVTLGVRFEQLRTAATLQEGLAMIDGRGRNGRSS